VGRAQSGFLTVSRCAFADLANGKSVLMMDQIRDHGEVRVPLAILAVSGTAFWASYSSSPAMRLDRAGKGSDIYSGYLATCLSIRARSILAPIAEVGPGA
jgi:hypothetical protein